MAILRDVEVTVSANGKRLQEYDDDAEEPSPSNTATRYIEALTGVGFQLHYSIKPTFQLIPSDIEILINIDGEHMDGHTLLRGKDLKELSHVPYSNSFSGARRFQDPGWTFQEFRFAQIKTCKLPRPELVHFADVTKVRIVSPLPIQTSRNWSPVLATSELKFIR